MESLVFLHLVSIRVSSTLAMILNSVVCSSFVVFAIPAYYFRYFLRNIFL